MDVRCSGVGVVVISVKMNFSKNYFARKIMDAVIKIGSISYTVGGLIGNNSQEGTVTAYNRERITHFFGKVDAKVIMIIRNIMKGEIDGIFVDYLDDSWEN